MKLIKCIVRPSNTDDVVEALRQRNVSGVTVSEIREFDSARTTHGRLPWARVHGEAVPEDDD